MKFSFRNLINIISINLFIITGLIILPSILLFTYRKINSTFNKNNLIDPRALYPIYKNKEFSRNLFNQKKPSEYKAYLGWRRKPIKLKYINIEPKYNNRISYGQSLNNSIWFFGGSTMWGTGVKDEGTIPSIFNKKNNKKVFNFGESAWTARQSLNQLMNVIADGYNPNKIIFYDGINEVLVGCKTTVKFLPTNAREDQIKIALENNKSGRYIIKTLFFKLLKKINEPYLILNKKLTNNININKDDLKTYNCDTDLSKANKIASNLVNDWFFAFLIANSIDAKFHAILQPTIYSSKTNFDYFTEFELERFKNLKKQYAKIYPLIIENIDKKCELNKNFCDSFINGVNWINDPNSQVFMDTFHVTEKGNGLIVEGIINSLNLK